jgi:hypothetical protein
MGSGTKHFHLLSSHDHSNRESPMKALLVATALLGFTSVATFAQTGANPRAPEVNSTGTGITQPGVTSTGRAIDRPDAGTVGTARIPRSAGSGGMHPGNNAELGGNSGNSAAGSNSLTNPNNPGSTGSGF